MSKGERDENYPGAPPCDPRIFKDGQPILAIDGWAKQIEEWVIKIRKESGQLVDWHYSGGIAQILYIGDRAKVLAAVNKLAPELEGSIMRVLDDMAGLFRNGVDTPPKGAIGALFDGVKNVFFK